MKKLLSNYLFNYLQESSFHNIHFENSQNIIVKWKSKLFSNISKQEQKVYSLERYPWHIFSFNLKPSYKSYDAILKYQNQFVKSFFVIIYQENKVIYCNGLKSIPYQDLITSKNLTNQDQDIYITHQNFRWTFTIPHEDNLDPFLYIE